MKYIITLFVTLFMSGLLPEITMALSEKDSAIDFSLPSRDGNKLSLSQFQGKVVYLDFWASWCGPCRHTIPWMSKLQQKFGTEGLQVIAINVDSNREDANKLLSEITPEIAVAFDSKGEVASSYAPPTMPSSYLLNRKGQIMHIHAGFHEGDDAALEKQVAEMLMEK